MIRISAAAALALDCPSFVNCISHTVSATNKYIDRRLVSPSVPAKSHDYHHANYMLPPQLLILNMMWILPIVGYAGVVLCLVFLTLAIASGLYYLSELVEEHTVLTKKLLKRLIYGIIAVQILLVLIDSFPLWLSLLSVTSHVVYAGNLRRFPTVKLSDPVLIVSCVLVILNHFLWFSHFSTPRPSSPPRYNSSYRYDRFDNDIPSFTEISSYFGICVWLVPFALFVSLSAGDNVLPSMGSEYATGGGTSPVVAGGQYAGVGNDRAGRGERKAKGLVKAAIDGTGEWVKETGMAMGFWRGDRAGF